MLDPGTLETIRAAVEAILPGDGVLASAAEMDVQRHVAELAGQYLPGFPDVIAALLDAYGADRGGPFASLGPDDRREVLRVMASDEAQDVRDAADSLFAFALGGMYSEWTGYDRDAKTLRPPAAWERVGFPGPTTGRPGYADR
ncbi:MAG: gluconate 2-dehydrogenase subunit 3 family protein [Actinomycetota bacterium]